MATVVKTLRLPGHGGSYDTPEAVGAYLASKVDNGKDIYINVEGGAVFTGRISAMAAGFYGNLIIRTEPAELLTAGPATIKIAGGLEPVNISNAGAPVVNPFIITIEELVLGSESQIIIVNAAPNWSLQVQNCYAAVSTAGGQSELVYMSAGSVVLLNNTIAGCGTSMGGALRLLTCTGAMAFVRVTNNALLVNTAGDTDMNLCLFQDTCDVAVISYNRAYNFGAGIITLNAVDPLYTTPTSLEADHNAYVDPEYVDTTVQSETDTLDDILARDIHLTAGSAYIDAANSAFAPAADIYGVARHSDIGATEYFAPPTTSSSSSSSSTSSSTSTSSTLSTTSTMSTTSSTSSTLSTSSSTTSTSTSSSTTSTSTSSSTTSSSTSTTSSSTSSTLSTTSTTSSSSTSSTTTETVCPVRYNILPKQNESGLLRRKNDERVETRGLPCKIYRSKEISSGALAYDEFDRPIVTGTMPRVLDTTAIIEPMQFDRERTGDDRGTDYKDFPFVGTFRFIDGVRKSDLVEIKYEYAEAAGLIKCLYGSALPPTHDLFTRFKVVNRITHGIRSDLVNKFYLVPTEETWTA